MRRFLELGPCPVNEQAVQAVSGSDYQESMLKQCTRYRDFLYRVFPWAKEAGLRFVIKRYAHDFGPYYEVAVAYDDSVEKQVHLAFYIESNTPLTWSEAPHNLPKVEA